MGSELYEQTLEKMRLEEGLIDVPTTPLTAQPEDKEITVEQMRDMALEAVTNEKITVEPEVVREVVDGPNTIGDATDDGLVKSVAKGMINGGIKAGESMSSLLAEGMNLPIKGYEKVTGKDAGFRFKAPSPTTLETNVVGDVTTGITQFGLQYYTGGNILKAGKLLQGGGRLASMSKEVVKGIYADFTAFKGDENRLADFLVATNNPLLNVAVTRYLASDVDDSDLEGRLKNVLEGGGIGAGVGMLTASLRGLRGAKKAMSRGDKKAATKIMNDSKQQVADIIDENADSLKFEFKEAVAPNKAAPIDLRLWQKEEAVKAAARIKGLSNSNPAAILDAAKAETTNINLDDVHTFDDVRGVANLLAETNPVKFKEWSYAEQLEMANLYNVDLGTMERYYKEGVVNEHVLLSSRILFDAQTQKITDMIMKNMDDNFIAAEVAQWGEYLNMTSSFSNISGRTLGAHNIKTGLARKSNEAAAAFIQERFGGPGGMAKFKEAWVASSGNLAELKGLNKQSGWKIMNDSILELRKNGLISGFKTLAVNGIGNPLNLYKEIGQRFFQGAVGGVRHAAGAEGDRIFMGESLAMLWGQVEGFMEDVVSTAKIVRHPARLKDFNLSDDHLSKLDRGYIRSISADNWGMGTQPGALARYIERMSGIPDMKTQAALRWSVDTLGSIINTPGNLMGAMDGHSRNVASRTQRYALAYRKAMNEGMGSIEGMKSVKKTLQDSAFVDATAESVEDFARRSTFQGELGSKGKMAQQFIKSIRPLGFPLGEHVIPFQKTPMNIFTQGVTEMNPVLGLPSAVEGAMAGGIQADEAIGRYAFGMGLTMAAIMAVDEGTITGAGPQDFELKKALMETGWRPYSIRRQKGVDSQGDPHYEYLEYGRLEPMAWVVGSIASVLETNHYTGLVNPNKEKDMEDYAAAYMGSLGEATMDKAFFTGGTQFIEMLSDPQRNLQRWLNQQAGSTVPALSRDINYMLQETPYLRKISTMQDAINNRLVGKQNKLPLSRNRWGDPIPLDKGWFLGSRTYFSPIGMSDDYAKPIDKEIKRLAIDGVKGLDGVARVYPKALPSMPDKYIQKAGRTINLDAWQYSRLVELSGIEVKAPIFGEEFGEMNMQQALHHLVTKDPLYKELRDVPDRQAVLIRNVITPYDKMGREQLIREQPDLQKRLQEAIRYDMLNRAGIARPEDKFKLLENLDD